MAHKAKSSYHRQNKSAVADHYGEYKDGRLINGEKIAKHLRAVDSVIIEEDAPTPAVMTPVKVSAVTALTPAEAPRTRTRTRTRKAA